MKKPTVIRCALTLGSLALNPVMAQNLPASAASASPSGAQSVHQERAHAAAQSQGCTAGTSGGAPVQGDAAAVAIEPEVKAILARHNLDRLGPADAKAIRDALCRANLWTHPGLDSALGRRGLSRKRLESLAPATQPASRETSETPKPTGPEGRRKVPPRE